MAGQLLVIANAALDGARAVVAPESLAEWELRGWEAVGPTSVPGRAQTDAEAAAEEKAEAARLAALLDPAPAKRPGATKKEQ